MNWRRDLPLKPYTTFKIGGSAKFFIEPKDTRQLRLVLRSAKKYKLPLLVIGAGSNLLVSDKDIDAIVMRLSALSFRKITFNKERLSAGSGVMLSQMLKETEARGLSGLEFLAGIPGTVGGALVMNAGAQRENIGNLVEEIKIMDYNGKIKTLNKRDIKFGYRSSNLAKYIILSAHFNLLKKNQEESRDRITRYLNYRKATQDLSKPSAGCIFKNPNGMSAGKLIDLCALKGKSIGGASISKRHANFILNQGNARTTDVLRLMDLIRKKVKNKFNITLKPEIKIWQ